MSTAAADSTAQSVAACYAGLRMTANEYYNIPPDGREYELIDGIVFMSPSPTPKHQHVVGEILYQLSAFLADHAVGLAFVETDVHLGKGPAGGDLVYKPEMVFIRAECVPQITNRITGVPDLVVEVISAQSRRIDTETKKNDYERCGVAEYWIIDPERESMTFYTLDQGRFVEFAPAAGALESRAVRGFKLDLARVRKAFKPW